MKKLSVIELEIGTVYPVDALVCACCGKLIKAHTKAVCVYDPTKGTTGFKRVVGVGCKPDAPVEPDACDSVAIRFNGGKLTPAMRGLVMRATQNYPGRKVEFMAPYTVITLYKDEFQGCQQLAKLPAALHLSPKAMEMSINNSEWMPYDSARVTDVLGVGYAGHKAYNI